jgi:hypothetical protein
LLVGRCDDLLERLHAFFDNGGEVANGVQRVFRLTAAIGDPLDRFFGRHDG